MTDDNTSSQPVDFADVLGAIAGIKEPATISSTASSAAKFCGEELGNKTAASRGFFDQTPFQKAEIETVTGIKLPLFQILNPP